MKRIFLSGLRWIRKAVDWVALIIAGFFCYFLIGFISYGLGRFFIKLSDTTTLPTKLHNSWEAGTYNKEIILFYMVSFIWVWYRWRERSLPKIVETIKDDFGKHRDMASLVFLFVLIFFGYKVFFIVLDHVL